VKTRALTPIRCVAARVRGALAVRRLLPACFGLAAVAWLTPIADLRIPEIQGRGHRSPRAGSTVTTGGVVTAVGGDGFYLQDPDGDGDPATSDAVAVHPARACGPGGGKVAPGDLVRITSQVVESIPGGTKTGNLSTTELASATACEVVSRRHPLPAPIVIGRGGRLPPASRVIAADKQPVNLQREAEAVRYRFDPSADGLDFYESLEGMRVAVRAPVAVSATRHFGPGTGEVFTLADDGKDAEPRNARTAAGGIFLQPDPHDRGDQNPEIVQLQFGPSLYPGPPPAIAVGDRLGDVTGVMDYDFGSFEVRATDTVCVRPRGARPETTRFAGSTSRLIVGTYNVLNLSATAGDSAQRAKLGRQIARNLRAPDILALEEIQDDSGEIDDGTTDASATLAALVDAIIRAGGPRYASFDVAPADGTLGGAPGANIRVAMLYNPARVRLLSRRSVTPAALAKAHVRDSLAFQGSRNPLEGVFEFAGRRLTVIANHLTSRYGSTPVFGAIQPFVQAGEAERAAQASALHGFVAGLVSGDPDAGILVLGDLNTFEFTDALARVLPGADGILTNLLWRERPSERYTYIYNGNSQVLDHIFVTAGLRRGAQVDIVHVNVDFPDSNGVEASDHEPVLAAIEMQ
jgi:predicted extracellular nuclease